MDGNWVVAFFLGAVCGAVPITFIAVYLFKRLLDLMRGELERQVQESKIEFEKLSQRQKEAYLKVIRTRTTDVGKRTVHVYAATKPRKQQGATVVHADFRKKTKKGPDDSGPKSSA